MDAPTPTGLEQALALRTDPAGGYVWRLPTGWAQGRGAWGGAVVGAAVRAVLAEVPDVLAAGQHVRSVSAQLVGAVPPGEQRVRVEVLRRGSGTTTVAVRVEGPPAGADGVAAGDDTLLAHAVAVLGAPRVPDLETGGWPHEDPPAALATGWRAVPVAALPGPPLAPEFVSRLELRPITGLPYSGGAEALGWIRPGDPPEVAGEDYLPAIADAWWTVLMPLLPAPRPVATISYALEVGIDPETLPHDEEGRVAPLLHRGRLRHAHQGHAVETRELWTEDGRLAAWNSQTVLVIR